MVILGGLEIVAAGYLIHKHNKNKKERARLEEEVAALEESSYPLFPADQRPPRRHTHSHTHSQSQSRPHTHSSQSLVQLDESDEERRERRRRRREKKKREEEFEYGRTNSAPPKMAQTQSVVAPGVVAGWPAHWKQSHVPPVQPPRVHTPQPQMNPQPQVNLGSNGYPQDVKYGFVPEIPHDQYPPPYSGPSGQSDRREERREERKEDRRGRERLEVRGRRERRSVSPMLGVYEEDSRSPGPRVRFSGDDVVLGGGANPPPKYRA